MKNFWTSLKKPILALAPMEGVTDSAFRQLCREYGADVVYTEFVPSDAIVHDAKKVLEKLTFDGRERPIVAQIFGHDPAAFAVAAKKIESLGFDGLDINLGCPARKVVNSGSGVALLRDPAFIRTLVESALAATSLPISLKMRTSIRKERVSIRPDDDTRVTALDVLEALHDLPIAAVMIHGRSAEQGHLGEIEFDMIRRVKQQFNGIVIANGGITTAADVPAMLAATGADGVGIARGAMGQPWIFRQAASLLAGQSARATTWTERRAVIARHAELLWHTKDAHGLLEFRKHFAWYIAGIHGAAHFRRQAVRVESLADVAAIVAQLPAD